jgi:hypothetical protein
VAVPPTVVRETGTLPVPAGLVTWQTVVVLQITAVPGFGPKFTVVAPAAASNPVPQMVTLVPPPAGPPAGSIGKKMPWEMVGAGTVKVKHPTHVPVRPATVTVTSTTPEAWAEVIASIEVALATIVCDGSTPPNFTTAGELNPAPAIVTTVPPSIEPLLGLTEVTVTVGGGGTV